MVCRAGYGSVGGWVGCLGKLGGLALAGRPVGDRSVGWFWVSSRGVGYLVGFGIWILWA